MRPVPISRFRAGGFTLLELLVALAIFALLSALGYGGLQSLLETRAVNARHDQDFARLTRAMVLVQQDLEQAIARPIRDNQGDAVAPLLGSGDATPALELSRSGWLNPAHSETPMLQRVGYRFDGEQLIRRTWPVLDRAPDTTPRDTVLLDRVGAVQWRYLDASGNWQATWPPAASPSSLPAAIELRIELQPWGTVRRLFRIPAP